MKFPFQLSSGRTGGIMAATLGLVALAAGCPNPTPPPPTYRATLSVQFPRGNQLASDGQSRLRLGLRARTSAGAADTTDVQLEVPDGKGLIFAEGGSSGNALQTLTPDDQGLLFFEYQCAPDADEAIAIAADNGNAEATVNVFCIPSSGQVFVRIDASACSNLQADGQSSCPVEVEVTQATTSLLPVAGDNTTVRVLSPTSTGNSVLSIDGTSGAAELAITTSEAGLATFYVKSPAFGLAEDVVVEVVPTVGGRATQTITIQPFEDKSKVELTADTYDVIGGNDLQMKVTAFEADGTTALLSQPVGVEVQVVKDAANDDVAFLADGFSSPLEVDANGEAVFSVGCIDVDRDRQVDVTVTYQPIVSAVTEKSAVRTITVKPAGSLILSGAFDPPSIRSDDATENTSELTVSFTAGAAPPNGTVRLSIAAADSARFGFIDPTSGDTLINQLDLVSPDDFDTEGTKRVQVQAVPNASPGIARVTIRATATVDSADVTVSREAVLSIEREPILQAIEFDSATPDRIGVRGSALPTTTLLRFSLKDDRGQAMAGVPVSFERSATADHQLTVTPSDISDASGAVIAVVSSGTISGPFTITATATPASGPPLTIVSNPVAVVAGQPNWAQSFMKCADASRAVVPPWTVACSVQLADRFTNIANDAQPVQFRAEGANGPQVAVATGGVAATTFGQGGVSAPGASIPSWSYGLLVPLSASDLAEFPGAAACFDSVSYTKCDVIELCRQAERDDLPVLRAFCPLPPGCTDAIDQAAVDLMTIIDPQPIDLALNPALFDDIDHYQSVAAACGYPMSCFMGSPAGLSVVDGDECPVNAGCMDFTGETECPQDGLVTLLATARGEEPFSDQNGNGLFDFNDVNGNGRHDEGESLIPGPGGRTDTWVDMPEPFLDKNDNCYRDDLTDRPRLTPLGQIANTDLFSDVDGNNVFGYSVGGSVTETNGVWDSDTELMFAAHVMEIQGGFVEVGQACFPTPADPSCHETARGAGLRRSGIADMTNGQTTLVSFRFTDINGNCPNPGFTGRPGITTSGPLTVGFSQSDMDSGACGFAELENAQRPQCSSVPFLSAPVLTAAITADCAEATVNLPATVTFSLGQVSQQLAFTVLCP